MMDHILTKNISSHLIHRNGQLLRGQGFSSDHRAMFADLNATELLSLTPQEQAPIETRRLVSGNIPNREAYIKELNRQLEAHNVHNRVSTLLAQAETGYLTIAQNTEYNNLDDTIIDCKNRQEERKTKKNKSLRPRL